MNRNLNTKSAAKADAAAVEFLMGLRKVAAEQQITATEAVREAIVVTGASRIGIKHAAILAGINARTARNTYDRVCNA
jgi:hypothetical protein